MADEPITKEILAIYISVLEKNVQQATLVVKTLEELNAEIKEVNAHLSNGLKSELIEHIDDQIRPIIDKIEKILTTVYMTKELTERAVVASKELNDKTNSIAQDIERREIVAAKALNEKTSELSVEIKDKISFLKSDVAEFRSAIKIDRGISIVGWASFILAMITIILKLFGRV